MYDKNKKKIKKLLYQQEIRKINSHKLRKQEKTNGANCRLPPQVLDSVLAWNVSI